MICKTKYAEWMSLKLDGLLDAEEERHLCSHLEKCPVCAPFWDAMKGADALLWASANEPAPVPANFQMKVMLKVAAMPLPNPTVTLVATTGPLAVPQLAHGVLPYLTRPLTGDLSALLPDFAQEWQRKVAVYVRGAAAFGFTLVVAAGLLLTLIMTGSLEAEGSLAPLVDTVRTFLQAADTWARSLFVGVGTEPFVVAGVVLALLALIGWQVVAGYQRTAAEGRGKTGALEALA